MTQEQTPTQSGRFERWFEVEVVQPIADFQDPKQEWRRLFSELLGTFFLVLVAAGGGMMSQAFPNTISRGAAVTAPGLMVMAIILFMGKVSGAHLNPAVSLAFSLRGDFPWRRVPGYIVAQLAGASLAAWFLQARCRRVRDVRFQLPRRWVLLLRRIPDGGGPHLGSGERHPRDGIGRAEPRRDRRTGRGLLHHPGGFVGQPDLWRVDEPRTHVRPRPGRSQTSPTTGSTSRGR